MRVAISAYMYAAICSLSSRIVLILLVRGRVAVATLFQACERYEEFPPGHVFDSKSVQLACLRDTVWTSCPASYATVLSFVEQLVSFS